MIQPTQSTTPPRIQPEPEPVSMGPEHRTPIADLLRNLRDEMMRLIRQEIALARAETVEKLRGMAINLGMLAGGAVLGLMALWFGFLALSVLITIGIMAAGIGIAWSAFLGALIVCVLTGVIGFVLANRAAANLRSQPLTPQRTLDTLQENTQWLKNKAT